MMHYCAADLVTLVLANPYTQSVREAGEGFQAGFYDSPMSDSYYSLRLHVRYLSDEPVGGFTVADSTALRIFEEERHSVASFGTNYVTFVPICGGAMHAFFRTVRIDLSCLTYVGIDGDMTEDKDFCLFSTLKHIDRVTEDYIGKWLDGSMPKHQTLGLADGVTDVVISNYTYWYLLNSRLLDNQLDMDSLRQVAIRKEGERYEK